MMVKFYSNSARSVSQPLPTTGGAVLGIPNHGVSLITATSAEVYAMNPPEFGVRKTLVCTSPTSAPGPIVRFSTGTTVTDGGANTQIQFGASTSNQVIDLVGVSSVEWAIVSMFPVASSGAGPTAGTT